MIARLIFGLLFSCAAALSARAEVPPPALDRAKTIGGLANLRYEARWGGLHAGDFVLDIEGGDGAYAGRFAMQTRGVIDWLIKLKLVAVSEGAAKSGEPTPRDYRVDYVTRSRESWTAVRFDPAGGPALTRQKDDRRDDNDDDPKDRPHPVPAELRSHTVDPLAAFIDAIGRAARHVENGEPGRFTIAVFDGLRRSDLDGQYLGRVTKNVLGRTWELHRLRLTTHAVAGFRKRHRYLWDESKFDVFLTADGRYIPVQIDSLGAGPTCNLVEICTGADGCRLPADH